MKNFKLIGILSAMFLVASTPTALQAQDQDQVNTSLQAQPETPLPVSSYVIEPAPNQVLLSEVLTVSKATTLVDSLQAVANVLADPEFKSLLIGAIEQLNSKPTDTSPNGWLNWITALALSLGAFVSYLFTRFGGYFKSASSVILLLFLSMTALQSCATCFFTSDYNYVGDSVKGCVECTHVKENLTKLQLKIFKVK